MITQAQSKGIQSASDAQTLRENYDTDNDGDIDDAKALVSDKQRASAQEKKTQLEQAKADILNSSTDGTLSKDDVDKVKSINSQIASADATIDDTTKMTLAQQYSAISQQKLDSQLGQAAGIVSNIDAGVNYAQNAMYGEMSQQQSTQAKLDAQGGVEGAVHTDVTDAQIKAKTQAEVLDAQLKEGGAKDGLLTKSADDLSKAADKLAQTAGTLAGGKTAADMKTIDEHDGSDKYIKAQERTAIEKATHSALASEFADNKEAKNRQIAEERAQYKAAGKEEEYLKDGKKYGFLDSNGNATDDAEAWVRGRATMTAAAMSKHEQGFISGSRMNTVTNPLTGESITNVLNFRT